MSETRALRSHLHRTAAARSRDQRYIRELEQRCTRLAEVLEAIRGYVGVAVWNDEAGLDYRNEAKRDLCRIDRELDRYRKHRLDGAREQNP